MLCQFTFKNFQSYKNETTFDFQATAISEFKDSLLSDENAGYLLPVSVIYGPNGGGKTTLLKALGCLISTVVLPIRELKKNRIEFIIQARVDCIPFLFDDYSRDEPTEFDVFFRFGSNEYNYSISLKNDEVISEALYWRAIGGKKTGTVFERDGEIVTLGPSINKSGISKSVNPKMPYLSFLAINYDIPIISEVQKWFESCYILNYGNPTFDYSIPFVEDDSSQKELFNAINNMSIDINGYRKDDSGSLWIKHKIGKKEYELNYIRESEGTKKVISVMPYVLSALNDGRLVLVDELDAKLHPVLLKYIIGLFKNPSINKKGAQLLFTSHDLTTMKNTVFRRDEIWFAAINNMGESQIYSLYDIRNEDGKPINATAAFDKQYLEGRYGADPYLKNMLTGDEWK